MNPIKLLLIACLPFAALITVPPALIGPEVEAAIRDTISGAGDNPAADIALAEYSRSWFGAEGRVRVRLQERYVELLTAEQVPAAQDEPEALAQLEHMRQALLTPVELDLTVSHGLVLFGGSLRLGATSAELSLDRSDEAVASLALEEDIVLTAHVAFDQSIDLDARIPAFELAQDQVTITFAGLNMEAVYDTSSNSVEYSGSAPSIAMIFEDGEFTITDSRLRGNNVELAENIWLGDTTGTIAQMRITIPAQEGRAGKVDALLFEGVTIGASVGQHESSGHLYLDGEYLIDHFTVNEYSGSLRVPMNMSNIPVESMQAYVALVSDPDYSTMLPSEEASQELINTFKEIFEPALAASPALRLGPATLTLNGEPIALDMQVRVDGDEVQKNAGLEALADPDVLGQILSASLDASLPKAQAKEIARLVLIDQIRAGVATQPAAMRPTDDQVQAMAAQQATSVLDGLVQQGMLTPDGNQYVAKVKYADGNVDINGTVLPLAMFAN